MDVTKDNVYSVYPLMQVFNSCIQPRLIRAVKKVLKKLIIYSPVTQSDGYRSAGSPCVMIDTKHSASLVSLTSDLCEETNMIIIYAGRERSLCW